MAKKWYKDAKSFREVIASYKTITEAAVETGVPRTTLNRWKKTHNEEPIEEETPPLTLQEAVEQHKYKQSETQLKKNERDLLKKAIIIDEISTQLAPLKEFYPQIISEALKPVKIKPVSNSVDSVEVNIFMTDWHCGEVIDGAHVDDLNEFNPDILAKRVSKYADIAIKWIDNYSKLHKISRINFLCMGDMINNAGMLHAEQSTDYARCVTQSLDASILMNQFMRSVIKHVNQCIKYDVGFRFVGTQGGNHSRLTRKMPSGRAASESNMDTFLFEHLAASMQNYSIDWHLGRGYFTKIRVANTNYDLSHGDAIKGGGGQLGIPAYGAKRQTQAQTMASLYKAMRDNDPTRIVQEVRIGHFHEYFTMTTPTGSFRIAPSLKGTSSWELETLGKVSVPMQLLEFVHESHGLIGSHEVNLSDTNGVEPFVWGALKTIQPAHSLI